MDKTYTTHVDVTLDDDTHVTGQNNIPMAFPDVTKAYFAWCQQKPKKVDKKENGKIVRDEKGKIVKETKNNIILSEIDTGIYSNQYYIVVETKNFPDKDSEDRKITISLHSKNGILSTKDAAIELTYVDADATTKELLFNNFYKDDNIHNKDSFKNKAVYEITLSPTDETKRKTWIDKLSGGKQEALYIKVEVSGVDGILYQGKELKDNENCNKFLLDNPVNIYRCYCNRDITAKEIKYITSRLGFSNIFTKSPLLVEADKNDKYKAFAEALNFVAKAYEINSCIRKIHFLAQSCHETKLTTMKETAAGKHYDIGEWGKVKEQLETEISNINKQKPNVDSCTALVGEKIDENKPQIAEIDRVIGVIDKIMTTNIRLLDSYAKSKVTLLEYRKIFEKEWKVQLDQKKVVKYKCKDEYIKALDQQKPKGAIQMIESIKSMGNTEIGDGPKYKGRGLIQITWRNNYIKFFEEILTWDECKKKLPKDITIAKLKERKNNYEELLEKYILFMVVSAGLYWNKNKINTYSDKDSIFDTSRLINYPAATKESQINGYDDRKKYYDEMKKLFGHPERCVKTIKKT